MSALVQMRGVWVEYGDRIVLERLNLDIEEGAFVSIVGPSGAGKSSLLRLVLGQEAPTRGTITLDGQPLLAQCGPERGVVFQRYSVFPHLTALGNLMLASEFAASPILARLFGTARSNAREQALAMMAAVGLRDAAGLYPAQLSGGMQQRLAIAQALMMRPRILLLDEPFSAVDRPTRRGLHDELQQLRQEVRIPILLVTHDLDEAVRLADRLAVLDHGALLQIGPPAEVVAGPVSQRVRDVLDLPGAART